MPRNRNTILIVDDDEASRSMLSLCLRQAGYNVRGAADGAEALRLLKGGDYAILVTDAMMRPMDGFTLAERAKELRPDLRVIMVSALLREGDEQGHPVEKLFPKPIAVEELVAWLA